MPAPNSSSGNLQPYRSESRRRHRSARSGFSWMFPSDPISKSFQKSSSSGSRFECAEHLGQMLSQMPSLSWMQSRSLLLKPKAAPEVSGVNKCTAKSQHAPQVGHWYVASICHARWLLMFTRCGSLTQRGRTTSGGCWISWGAVAGKASRVGMPEGAGIRGTRRFCSLFRSSCTGDAPPRADGERRGRTLRANRGISEDWGGVGFARRRWLR